MNPFDALAVALCVGGLVGCAWKIGYNFGHIAGERKQLQIRIAESEARIRENDRKLESLRGER